MAENTAAGMILMGMRSTKTLEKTLDRTHSHFHDWKGEQSMIARDENYTSILLIH